MDLNAFPDTVLRAVFDQVPLSDLIHHIPLVCHRWHSLQPSVLSAKKAIALTILVGPNFLSLPLVAGDSVISFGYEDELTNEDGSAMFPSPMDDPRLALTLMLNTFTSKLVNGLIDKLRKVAYFKLRYRKFSKNWPPIFSNVDPEAIPLIICLLNHWACSLVTLKLHCTFTSVFEPNQQVIAAVAAQMGQLFETINTIQLLEHLTLDFIDDMQMIKSLDLPILGQLKEFFFDTNSCPFNLILPSLERYAEANNQLRRIGLGNWILLEEFVDKLGQSPLAKRFTKLQRLAVFGPSGKVAEIDAFVNTFSNLTCFSGSMGGLTLARMTAIIAPLPHLIKLNLCVSDLADPLKAFSSYDDEPADQMHPLASVKVLALWVNTHSHSDAASRHWPRIFPNLQILHLVHWSQGCRICNLAIDEFHRDRDPQPEKIAACIQRTLLSFKQQFQRTLKKVYYCRNGAYENLKVFTLDTILDVNPSDYDEWRVLQNAIKLSLSFQ